MLEDLKAQVLLANQQLQKNQLVIYTWGNVSGIDREKGLLVIKPSGIPYDHLTSELMTVTDLDGNVIESTTKPSTDLMTHIILYKAFPDIGGIAHTHSKWATVWAQMGKSIPCYGTTHADFFYGKIPCTEHLPDNLVNDEYETNTGKWIADQFSRFQYDYTKVPGVLVSKHGPFTWGKDAMQAVYYSTVMERVAEIAYWASLPGPLNDLDEYYIIKHYERKHGINAYYGQND
jgi:L-ribulose-5-phosphate 4-epimerase